MSKVRKKGKAGDSKEIEKLKKRREKASEKGDYAEESKLCNAIGESYFQNGEYKLALTYHRDELALSEAVKDPLSMGIACRKVGECLCEMGSYEEAVKYQKKHLELSRKIRDLKEEQRALATLGRTFYVYSQSALEGEDSNVMKSLLLKARHYYEHALEACNKLTGELSDGGLPPRELLEMRSRLYLNLGLVFEDQGDLKIARDHILKALHIVKELGDSATVYRCHNGLGLLYQKEKHVAKAEESFQEALKVARLLGDKHKEADTLKDIAQICMDKFEFERAKICLKGVVKLLRSLLSSQEDLKQEEDRLKNVRKILYYSLEAEKKSLEDAHDKAALYDKLGDVCCALKAFPAALKFYGNQLSVAEKCGFGSKEMSAIYVSLAMTHTDCGQFSQALLYYDRELKLWSGAASQECSSWSAIALAREKAGQGMEQVMEAYSKAASFAERAQQPKKMMRVYKSAISYLKARTSSPSSSCSSHSSDSTPPVSPSCRWRQKLSHLLESHPYLADEQSSEEEEGTGYVATPPDEAFLMSSSESEEGESDGEGEVAVSRGVACRPKRDLGKAKLNKKVNDKGETSLHVAAISGKLSRVKALIQRGAEVNRTDNAGWTPLHEACNFGYTDIARALLDAGAAVDPVSGLEGTTPLMDAAWNGHPEVVMLLVEEGEADLTRKNLKGHTALAVVNKALSEENEDSYRDYHKPRCIIRDYLVQQMRRRGLSVSEATPFENNTNRIRRDEVRRGDVRGQSTVSRGRGVKRARQQTGDRWTSIVSSDEEDSDQCDVSTGHQRASVESDSLLGDLTTRPAYTAARSISRSRSGTPPMSSGNSCRRLFNPLGQVKPSGPALIPEESVSLIDEVSGCPIIDNWLVDDLGASPPPKKQRRRDSSVERESRALLGLSSSSSGSGRGKSGSRGRPKVSNTRSHPEKGSPGPKSSIGASPGRRAIVSERGLAAGSGNRIEWRVGGARGREIGGARSRTIRGRDVVGSAERVAIASSGSDSEPEQDFQIWKVQSSHQAKAAGFSSSRGSHTQRVSRDHYHHPSTPPHPPSSLLNRSCDTLRHPCTPPHPPPSISSPHDHHVTIPRPSSPPQPPIRVKVRIEHSSYLIPCPLKTADHAPTTISWLADRASDRYFAQRGRRPLLELTMVDGASLCASDLVGHVLKMDEEVLGVVKKWVCPPLAERYRVACTDLEVDCNSKVLEIFEASNQATSLRLRQCDLQPGDCAPLFQALQSQPKLSVLSLADNRYLKDKGMVYLVQALSRLNGLTALDLSSTGITHQLNVSQVSLDIIEQRSGKGVCFIFDGFDEFAPQDGQSSIVYKIINKTYLPHSIVIVASRPAAIAKLRHKASIVIEVVGFLNKQILEYFDRYPFSTPTQIAELKRYLEFHPNILHLCYLPIHATMVAFLFQEMGEVPKTETDIYTHFTRFTLIRNLTKTRELEPVRIDLPSLTGEEGDCFKKICLLAFEKTILNKQVLDQSEVSSHFQVKRSIDSSLGLITVDRTAGLYGYKNIYTFMHLTFQEYLAAYHITTLSKEEQLKLIQDYGDKNHMLVVWKFLCGLIEIKPLYDNRFKSILHKTEGSTLFHIQCGYESQQKIVCAQLLKSVNYHFMFEDKYLSTPDFTAIGYVTNTTLIPTKLSFLKCDMNTVAIDALLSEMEDRARDSIHALHLAAALFDDSQVECTRKLLDNLKSLKSLSLEAGSEQHTHSNKVSSIKLSGLKELSLIYVDIRPLLNRSSFLSLSSLHLKGDLKTIINCISHCRHLKELDLSDYLMSETNAQDLAKSLKDCDSLERINLDKTSLSSSGVAAIFKSLRHCYLKVKASELPGSMPVSELLKYLEKMTNLQSLEISMHIAHLAVLSEYARKWKKFKELNVSLLRYSSDSCSFPLNFLGFSVELESLTVKNYAPSDALPVCPDQFQKLEKLILYKSMISSLEKPPLNLPYLQELHIDSALIDDAEIEILIKNIQKCSNLEILSLPRNHISSHGGKMLAAIFHLFANLKKVNLKDNDIDSTGSHLLVSCLRSCLHFQKLNLLQNPFHGSSMDIEVTFSVLLSQ